MQLALPVLGFLLLTTSALAAGQPAPPSPPCGAPPQPPYPASGQETIRAWQDADLPAGWTAAPCAGWPDSGARMVVALSASFAHEGSGDALLARFAAVSSLRGLRYWSVTDKQWRPLIIDAAALAGPDRNSRRSDFSLDELKRGAWLNFLEEDSRSGRVVYRMRLLEYGPERFALAVENAAPIKFMQLTLFAPGDMQSVYFVERLAPGRWGYYALLRARRQASSLVAGHGASYMNRAQALYRHFLGQPSDQEPPAAR